MKYEAIEIGIEKRVKNKNIVRISTHNDQKKLL